MYYSKCDSSPHDEVGRFLALASTFVATSLLLSNTEVIMSALSNIYVRIMFGGTTIQILHQRQVELISSTSTKCSRVPRNIFESRENGNRDFFLLMFYYRFFSTKRFVFLFSLLPFWRDSKPRRRTHALTTCTSQFNTHKLFPTRSRHTHITIIIEYH